MKYEDNKHTDNMAVQGILYRLLFVILTGVSEINGNGGRKPASGELLAVGWL